MKSLWKGANTLGYGPFSLEYQMHMLSHFPPLPITLALSLSKPQSPLTSITLTSFLLGLPA